MSNNIQDTGSSTATGAGGQQIITGTPTTGSVTSAVVQGSGAFTAQLSGTWTGAQSFEESPDGGKTWTPIDVVIQGDDQVVQSATANGVFGGIAAGNAQVRVRATGAMTGTAVVTFLGTVVTDLQHVVVANQIPQFIQKNPVVTAGAYTANFVVGGIQTLTGALKGAAGRGVLENVSVVDSSAQGAQLSIFLFKALPTLGTYADHGALVLNAADLPNLIGKVDIATTAYDSAGTAVKVATVVALGLDLQGDVSGNVYAIATTTGTPTLTALCLTFNYGVKQY